MVDNMTKIIIEITIQTAYESIETFKLNDEIWGSKIRAINIIEKETKLPLAIIRLEDGRAKHYMINRIISWITQEV